jgi:radical SAM superfamily enzyme YgiQ (UPF0313 family)
MKVTLINARNSDSGVMPFGILSMAAVLEREGHEVQVFDPFFGNTAFFRDVESFQPDLVGIGLLTASYRRAGDIVQELRKRGIEAPIGAGGFHVTTLPVETLNGLGLDFVVVGEGEQTILEVCERFDARKDLKGVKGVVYRDNGDVVKNPPRDLIENLDDLPPPAWHKVNVEKYLIPPGYIRSYYLKRTLVLFTDRGCPYHCTFCASNKIFGRTVRFPSVDYSVRQFRDLEEKYQLDGLYFMNDTFTINRKLVLEFCRVKRESGSNLTWACQGHVNNMTERLADEMRSSGCIQIDFGVESGSDRVLRSIKKGSTVEQIEKAFAICKKYDIRPYASIMVGHETEEWEDVEKTAAMLKRIRPVYTSVMYSTPIPGSELFEHSRSGGTFKFSGDLGDFEDEKWDFRKSIEPVTPSKTMTNEELVKARALLQNTNFGHNYFKFVTWRSLPFVLEILWTLVRHSRGLLPVVRHALKTRKVDDFIDFALEKYRVRKMLAKCQRVEEL